MANTETQAVGQEIGRKISAKTVGFDSDRILELVMQNKGTDVPLYRVLGMATGLSEYESSYGDGEALIGQFEAETSDGKTFNGSALYLPGYLQQMAVANLKAAGDGAGLSIALDIYARYDGDAASKYVFVGRSLVAPDTRAVDAIKAQIGNTPIPALPAPAKG